eukprot:COSAG01_NODE_979_length_12356_cov_224.025618_8_plen_73_part_00
MQIHREKPSIIHEQYIRSVQMEYQANHCRGESKHSACRASSCGEDREQQVAHAKQSRVQDTTLSTCNSMRCV